MLSAANVRDTQTRESKGQSKQTNDERAAERTYDLLKPHEKRDGKNGSARSRGAWRDREDRRQPGEPAIFNKDRAKAKNCQRSAPMAAPQDRAAEHA